MYNRDRTQPDLNQGTFDLQSIALQLSYRHVLINSWDYINHVKNNLFFEKIVTHFTLTTRKW